MCDVICSSLNWLVLNQPRSPSLSMKNEINMRGKSGFVIFLKTGKLIKNRGPFNLTSTSYLFPNFTLPDSSV